MDADLQHPPTTIAEMVKLWEEGYLIVNSEKDSTKLSFLRKVSDSFFYWFMEKVAGLKLGQADFRLIDKVVLNRLNSLKEKEKFVRGLVSWFGYKTTRIKYFLRERQSGVSKFSRNHLFDFAFQGITSFSVMPLRILLNLGFFIFIPSVFYFFLFFLLALSNKSGLSSLPLPPGWATLSVTIVFFGSINLLSLGIIGEYIGRIFSEVKQRPNFIIEEENISKK